MSNPFMTLNGYQREASRTNKGTELFTAAGKSYEGEALWRPVIGMYNALALNGEAGELAEKIKKAARDGVADAEAHGEAVAKEIGDCLWYISQLARDFGYTLEEIAALNLKKLRDREARGKLGGSGDDR